MKAKNVILIATLLLCCITTSIFSSCVKQKNCEEGEIGYFEYLEEPFIVTDPDSKNKDEKVVAKFTYEIGGVELIVGNVPSKFKTKEPIKVRACIKLKNTSRYKDYAPHPVVYKLKCIEKED
ncbi:MAG: hypothetical protein GX330_00640 [Bacteroidales bacterium]|nr:hypothetical protein [Bacteroidales bacterium]